MGFRSIFIFRDLSEAGCKYGVSIIVHGSPLESYRAAVRPGAPGQVFTAFSTFQSSSGRQTGSIYRERVGAGGARGEGAVNAVISTSNTYPSPTSVGRRLRHYGAAHSESQARFLLLNIVISTRLPDQPCQLDTSREFRVVYLHVIVVESSGRAFFPGHRERYPIEQLVRRSVPETALMAEHVESATGH